MILRPVRFPFRYAFSIIKKKIGKLDTLKIEPLYAFGNEEKIFFKGRVVESYKQSKPSAKKGYLQNLLGALRRYAGSSVPEAKVTVEYHGEQKILESDVDGIIECSVSLSQKDIRNKNDKICFSLKYPLLKQPGRMTLPWLRNILKRMTGMPFLLGEAMGLSG